MIEPRPPARGGPGRPRARGRRASSYRIRIAARPAAARPQSIGRAGYLRAMWGLVAVWLSTIGASSGDFAGHDRPGDGPDLRGEAIWPVEGELAWLRALEAPAVLAELQEVVLADAAVAVAANASVFTPKFSASWDLATAAQDWQALPLQNKGRADAAGCAIAPITCGVLAKLHPHLVPRGPAASEVGVRLLKLAGGASLRRHVGPGGRLVAHLGVSVPPSASLTVNGQELHWGEGKLLVFDDAFEHSAQNLAADQPRYILQVTIPHPRGQAGVTIDTDLFALTIDTETCTVTTTLKFPSPVKSSAPVPFVSLYNRISDSQPSDWDACVTASSKGPGLLEVTAAHGYGHIRLSYTAHPHFVIFTLNATDGWHGDPVERHISFGQFWTGIVPDCVPTDGNCTAPTVMGRLQGPRWFGGTGEVALPSAGFVSITNHSYYKYVFYAVTGDAVGVTIAPSAEVGHVVKEIAKASGTFFDNPNRFKSWLWTQGITGSASLVPGSRRTGVFNHSYWVDRSLALGVQLLFISNAIQVEDWEINTHEYPNITENAAFVRSHGLGFGIHTLPYPPGNAPPENLVQDGLAPTYRSGRWSSPTAAVGLEDMGFWWGHDNQGSLAVNGNPNGPCPQLVPGYDCSRWGSNMSLFNATWSTAGKFRAGGAIAFDGKSSFGVAKHVSIWDGWGADITLGLTIHPASDHGVIVSRAGSFELAMDAGRLVWSVTTAGGGAVNVSSATTLKAGECYTLKLTYNSSSAEAKILIENRLDAVARHPLALTGQPLGLAASTSDIIFGATAATVAGGLTAAADGSPVKWAGAMEEVYLKNVSTEHRRVYIYTDNVRPTSAGNVRVFDLSTAHGRTYYAGVMSNILNAADFDTTQWDGFEILLLMPLYNFNHSAKTFGDKMYRGIPSPDWYNLGWPLAVGQDWLAAMEETHRMTNSHTAVECSFMAPGSGPWVS